VFHGAVIEKARAVAKERQVSGYIRPTMVRGQRRYLVLTRRNPRTVWSWPATLKTFATLEAARAHARSIRGSGGAFLSRLSNGRYGVAPFAEARKRGWV
jgi:hypothetical protein